MAVEDIGQFTVDLVDDLAAEAASVVCHWVSPWVCRMGASAWEGLCRRF